MTRDEAINIFHATTYPDKNNPGAFSYSVDRKWSERAIDGFVALGILNLDEPKSTWEKFNEIVCDWVPLAERGEFLSDMEKAGLKVVEK